MIVDQIRLDRPTSGLQRLEGRFGGHTYDLHRHETYGVGLQRLMRAQSMIVEGVALSEATAAAGFADQSHLTRHFAARFGITPGRWAALSRRG